MTRLSLNNEVEANSRRNIFELFTHRVSAELGPLHPHWFEDLTAEATALGAVEDGNGVCRSSVSHCVPGSCSGSPMERAEVHSQAASTPKILGEQGFRSPEALTPEQRPVSQARAGTAEGSKREPWFDSSPGLFGLSKDSPEISHFYRRPLPTENYVGDLFDTPKGYVDFSKKRISESLGAQVDPDMSWSSSLNTPPAITPTLILSKTEEKSCPKGLSAQKSGIIVRKLFPSVAKETDLKLGELASENDDSTRAQLPDVNNETDDPVLKNGSFQDELADEMSSPWKQTLPDALQDPEVRKVVASVLDGAEDVLSVFFSSSSSVRRAKTKDGDRGTPDTSPVKDCSLMAPPALVPGPSNKVQNSELAREKDKTEKPTHSSIPVVESEAQPEITDCGNSQWSQISFPDISDSQLVCLAVSQSSKNDPASLKGPRRSSPAGSLLLEPSPGGCLALSSSTKKPRKFVYSLQGCPLSGEPKCIAKQKSVGNLQPVVSHSGTLRNETAGSATPSSERAMAEKKTDCSQSAKEYGLSQLSTIFADNFSQELNDCMTPSNSVGPAYNDILKQKPAKTCSATLGQGNKKIAINHLQNNYAPKASCAALNSQQQLSDLTVVQESNLVRPSQVASRISDLPQELNNSKDISDHLNGTLKSPKQSYQPTKSSRDVSFSNEESENCLQLGFRTASNKTISLSHEAIEKAKAILDETYENDMSNTSPKKKSLWHSQHQTLYKENVSSISDTAKDFVGPAVTHVTTESAKILQQDKISKNPESTTDTMKHDWMQDGALDRGCNTFAISRSSKLSFPGFKTASENPIQVSSGNLERARCLFEDVDEKLLQKCISSGCVDVEDDRETAVEILQTGPAVKPFCTGSPSGQLSCQKMPDTYSSLTESQRADVIELCNILEEADTQYEFTQFKLYKETSAGTEDVLFRESHDKDTEHAPALVSDMLTVISCDGNGNTDSNREIQKLQLMKNDTSDKAEEQCNGNEEKGGNVSISICNSMGTRDNELVEKNLANMDMMMTLDQESSESALATGCTSSLARFEGFCSARGVKIEISKESLKKASQLLDLDVGCVQSQDSLGLKSPIPFLDFQGKTAIRTTHYSRRPNVNTCNQTEAQFYTERASGVSQSSGKNLSHDDGTREKLFQAGNGSSSNSKSFSNLEQQLSCGESEEQLRFEKPKALDPFPFKGSGLETRKSSESPRNNQSEGVLQPLQFSFQLEDDVDKKLQTPQEQIGDGKDSYRSTSGKRVRFQEQSFAKVPAVSSNAHGFKANLGFQTARGTAVRISEKFLKKAKDMFSDLEEKTESGEECPETSRTGTKEYFGISEASKSSGKFSITRGKRASVYEEGLEGFKSIIGDNKGISVLEKHAKSEGESSRPANKCVGTVNNNSRFSTASGKNIFVSEKAIKEAKAVFKECDEIAMLECATDRESEVKNVSTGFPLGEDGWIFSTGSGKEVSMSKDSLQEGVTSHECDKTETVEPVAKDYKNFQGKGTVYGIQMSVSEKALHKDRTVLEECDGNPDSDVSVETGETVKLENGVVQKNVGKFSCGFRTARGNKVSVSEKALQEARNLLNEFNEIENTKRDVKATSSAENLQVKSSCGFSTASGTRIPVSEKALQKAKTVLKEYDDTPDSDVSAEIKGETVKIKNSVAQKNIEKVSCGFSTAGGKKVSVSEKALQEARNLLNEFNEIENTNSDVKATSSAENLQVKSSCGFSTASGTRISVSEKALQKAKTVLNEYDDSPGSDLYAKCKGKIVEPNCNTVQKNLENFSFGFSTAGGKKVSVSEKALQEARSWLNEFNDIENANSDVKATSSAENLQVKSSCGFSTASGTRIPVSEKGLQKAKTVLKEYDDTPDSNVGAEIKGETVEFKNSVAQKKLEKFSCGFSTASGNKVSVSEKALQEARNLLNNIDEIENTKPDVKATSSAENLQVKSSCGFSTASGTRIPVSEKGLQKAKTVLKEYDDTPDSNVGAEIKGETVEFKNSVAQKKLEKFSCGFSTASGNKVSVSEKALQEARNLLNEFNEIENTNSDVKATSSAENLQVKSSCGFSTASGARIPVSEKGLQKAKTVLKEYDDTPDSNVGAEIKGETVRRKSSIVQNNLGKVSCGFSTASGKTVSVCEKALQNAKAKLENYSEDENNDPNTSSPALCVKDIHGKQREEPSSECTESYKNRKTLTGPTTLKTSTKELDSSTRADSSAAFVLEGGKGKLETIQEGASLLNFNSHNFGDCTDTQQRYLEQEAMESTKAFLEDEDLTEESFQESLKTNSLPRVPDPQDSLEKGFRGGKRLRPQDLDLKEEPPLKRQLLAEFDRTLDRFKHPALKPCKTCPNSVLTDRGQGRYSIPLESMISLPFGDKKRVWDITQVLKRAEPQKARPGLESQEAPPAKVKTGIFVPPFQKRSSSGSQNGSAPPEPSRPPSVFVPPFKKAPSSLKDAEEVQLERLVQTAPKSTPLRETGEGCSPSVPPCETEQAVTRDSGHNESAASRELGDGSTPLSHPSDSVRRQEVAILSVRSVDSGRPESPCSGQAVSSPEEHNANSSDHLMIQNLDFARGMQEMRIRKKKRQTIKPLPGSLCLTKTSGVSRVSLRAAVGGKSPAQHTQQQLYVCGVNRCVLEISSENAESFRFSCRDHFGIEFFSAGNGVQLADGGCLIPDNKGTAGKEEFYRALCDTPGVDPKLISESWVYNHYRWIVWKRAAMERAFPLEMGSRCLTPEQVLLQLKYRYDLEIDNSQRSALRKIMERDDTPAKTLVLCVCRIVSMGSLQTHDTPGNKALPYAKAKTDGPVGVIEVTDGWYAIKALLDAPLTAILRKGRLAVGGKIVTHGADLIGCQDACSPLEAPEALMLKICANSTRLARWDTKLGFHRDPRPFHVPLSSLFSNGGRVGCVDVVVLRTYPIQWMEKKADGVFVFRGDRAEEREARRHNENKQKTMEALFAKIQSEFEKEQEAETSEIRNRRQRFSHQEIQALQEGEELYEATESDPVCLEACLSEQQLMTLNNYRRALNERKQTKLQEEFQKAIRSAQDRENSCPERDVTPVWKLLVVDCKNLQNNTAYFLNIWRPSTEVCSLLKEGCRYKIYQLATSETKRRIGNAAVQLTAMKKTQFEQLQVPPELLCQLYASREAVSFRSLLSPRFQPVCGEVDLVGYVISITGKQGGAPVVYLVNENRDFVAVKCWAGLSQLALEDIVQPRALLAVSNVQARPSPAAAVPTAYAAELSVFSANPKETHLQAACTLLRSAAQGIECFFEAAEEKLSKLIKEDFPCQSLKDLSSIPKTPIMKPDVQRESSNLVPGRSPQQSLCAFEHLTPTCGKPPLHAGRSDDKGPKSLKRKRGLIYLSRIPSPPPLAPLRSPCVNKTFQPPRRCASPLAAARGKEECRSPGPAPEAGGEWVKDEELAQINTQDLLAGSGDDARGEGGGKDAL
ncbi:breast cancer type 2 susceptibility protein isoform X2 [Lepisosteus oculatus]|uniref:breast cancer type 2 susceptibility protein isoform X2 n=1 Tax=Lepisosteus oculatus TaxID=7918 RepID=UPI003713934C